MTTILLLASLLRAAEPAPAPAASAPPPAAASAEAPKLSPPQPPVREKAVLETASDLALDMSRIVIYLENGQAFFKAYAKGTHTAAENKAFVKFLEDYERELNDLKKEQEALKQWTDKKSELKGE